MASDIIDLSEYLQRGGQESAAGTMGLWGAQGERSRFALPLWRMVHLAEAERGAIVWRKPAEAPDVHPYLVLDLASDPARVGFDGSVLDSCPPGDEPSLHDLEAAGLVIHLGSRDGREWCLVADGGDTRTRPLEARRREDILFLAGECAGLLFLRDFANDADL